MRSRHAAAHALSGWYLMVPPDSTVPHSVNSVTPISHWSTIAKFESADPCKQVLTELKTRMVIPAKLDATGRPRRFQKRQPADPELATYARVDDAACIATDDPRLKEKSRMKPRHAAALALIGWYRMLPTTGRG